VNIFLKLSQPGMPAVAGQTPPGSPVTQQAAPSTEPHLTLSLNHVPLYVALDYIAKLSNMKLKIDPYAVSIVPLSEPTDVMVTKEYQVPPTFIPPKPLDSAGALPNPVRQAFPIPTRRAWPSAWTPKTI